MNWPTASRILILIILVSPLIFLLHEPTARAQTVTTVGIFNSPDYNSSTIQDPLLTPGSTFIIDVNATHLPPIVNSTDGGINAFDITIHFDPAILSATSISANANSTPPCPSPECLFDQPNLFKLNSTINDSAGIVRLAVVLFSSRVDGSGILFRVEMKVVGTGPSPLDIDQNSTLVEPSPLVSIPFQILNGSFDNRPFIVSASPSSLVVLAGQSVSTDVSVAFVVGTPQTVNLSVVSGLPSGANASFNPSSMPAPFTSQLTIQTVPATPFGTYTLKVRGDCPACSQTTGFHVDTTITLRVNIRDMAVLSVTSTTIQALIGDQVSFLVTAQNKGNQTETFSINIVGNETLTLASETGLSLNAQASQQFAVTWNTATFAPGVYTITARIPTLPGGESNTSNNQMSDGSITLRPAGFTLTLSTDSVAVSQGQTISLNVTATVTSGGVGEATLSINGLPSGVSADFKPSRGTPNFISTLTISAASTAAYGTFHVQLTAAGASPTNLTLVVIALPVPHFTYTSSSLAPGQEIRFDASQSVDPDSTIAKYSWDFGDGSTITGQTASHTYLSTGTFTVTLTVTDDRGATQKTSQTITIFQTMSPATFLTSPLGLGAVTGVLAVILAGVLLFVRARGKKRAV